MGALLSVFLSLFGGTPTAVEARDAAGGEGLSENAAPLTDPAPETTAPAPTAPAASAPPATAPAASTAPPATAAPHKAEPVPEPADVRAAALKAEAQCRQSSCGVPQKDEADWKLYDAPPRIKECTLNAADRAKLTGHLDSIFDDETLQGRRVIFDPLDIVHLTNLVVVILETEPMLITDVPMGITVVGDLHGQLHDLHRVFKAEERDGKPGWENMRYLFLGDYVDRGRQSLEILMCLFSLKCLYPDRIFLLRGNHEFISTNQKYGFPVELWDRYEEEVAFFLYQTLNATFCWLSVCAIIGDQYFCAHGGIALSGMTRRHWKGILKPYKRSQDDVVVHDTIWSDPAGSLRGSSFNAERHTSHYYGLDLLATALHSMECKILIRAHSMLETGYDFLGNLCLSIFTATGMSLNKNNGAIAVVNDQGKIRMSILPVDLERVKWDKKLKRMDANHFEDTTTDDEGSGTEPEDVTVYGGDDLGSGVLTDVKNPSK